MKSVHAAFSDRYAQARSKFLAAAQAAGLAVTSHLHPLTGSEGEPLAMDVVREGDAKAERVLLVGAATGYAATLLAWLGAEVVALESEAELATLGATLTAEVILENYDVDRADDGSLKWSVSFSLANGTAAAWT